MKQSTIILFNSLVGLLRILLAIAIGFWATRLLLSQLGFVDYGILAALGATGILSTTLVSGLANASRRHLAYEIGRGEGTGLQEVFSSALCVFFVLGLLLCAVGMALTPLVLSVVNVPDDRLDTARVVYWSVVATWVYSTVSAPWNAMLHAHQHLLSSSVFEITGKLTNLAVIASLYLIDGDKLLQYALVLLAARFVTFGFLVFFVLRKYPSSHPRVGFISWDRSARILTFAGWSLLSMLVYLLRQQGSVLFVNIIYGPVVNAAYALSNIVSGYVHQASQAIQNAVQPAMTTMYARENSEYFGLLISSGSRYTLYVSLFFFIPVFLEANYFCELWLGEYPAQMPEFTRLVTLACVLSYAVNGYGLALTSQDRLSELIPVSSGIQAAAFFLGVFFMYRFDMEARTLPLFIIGGMLLLWVVVPLAFGSSLGFSAVRWVREVLAPSLAVVLVGFIVGIGIQANMEAGFYRLSLVTVTVAISIAGAVLLVGSTAVERRVLRRLSGNIVRQLRA